MIKNIKDHMKQPLTYGWLWKNTILSMVFTGVIYGIICLIGYIGSQKGEEDEEDEIE